MSIEVSRGSHESAHSAIDPPAGLPPAEIGTALRGADAATRSVLAAAWIALALCALDPRSVLLAAVALPSLLGVAPRALTVLGSALAAWVATEVWGAPAAIALIVLGLLRLRIHGGRAGRWLRDVRRIEQRRAAALVATGIALARPDADATALAGDRYEGEGRLRAELAARGAQPAVLVAPLRGWTTRLVRGLRRWPALVGAIERAALRESEPTRL